MGRLSYFHFHTKVEFFPCETRTYMSWWMPLVERVPSIKLCNCLGRSRQNWAWYVFTIWQPSSGPPFPLFNTANERKKQDSNIWTYVYFNVHELLGDFLSWDVCMHVLVDAFNWEGTLFLSDPISLAVGSRHPHACKCSCWIFYLYFGLTGLGPLGYPWPSSRSGVFW